MTDFSRMSPVAQVRFLQRQNAQLTLALKEAALQSFRLKQEVTGGLQVIWTLANKQPDKKLVISAVELVTSMGSLQRSRQIEADTYTFEALQPTEEDHQKLAAEIVQPTETPRSLVAETAGQEPS